MLNVESLLFINRTKKKKKWPLKLKKKKNRDEERKTTSEVYAFIHHDFVTVSCLEIEVVCSTLTQSIIIFTNFLPNELRHFKLQYLACSYYES